MIQLVNCKDANRNLIYTTFTEGFSDYMIEISLTEEEFYTYFFGHEGNQIELSYVAIDQEGHGLGVVLGGIRPLDGRVSMRCGGLCVVPNKRGTSVAKDLMAAHMYAARAAGCDQLVLEVIKGNDRAVNLYEGLGYKQYGNLWYYRLDNQDQIEALRSYTLPLLREEALIKALSFEDLVAYRKTHADTHLSWQNEMASIDHLKGNYYGLFIQEKLVGALAHAKSSVHFLAIDPAYRRKGYALNLLSHILKQDPSLTVLRTSSSDNPGFEGLMEALGFAKDKLSQYEMALPLKSK